MFRARLMMHCAWLRLCLAPPKTALLAEKGNRDAYRESASWR